MRQLTANELQFVSGGTDQDTTIAVNGVIVAIGAGFIAAGSAATAPVWLPAALIGVSAATTASFIMEEFS